MSDGVWIALIGASSALLIPWVNWRLNRMDKQIKEDRDECRRELEEVRKDYQNIVKYIQEKRL